MLLNILLAFWVWDLTVMPPGFRQPQFERQASHALVGGETLHLWVEQGLADKAPSGKAVAELLELFAVHAPKASLNPEIGIVDLERDIFGRQPAPPSFDRDIHLVIAALPPYEKNGKKFGFDGYFNVFDQLSEAEAAKQEQHSNERNVIYVNALQDLGSEYMRGVVAHELNHLLTHGQYDEEKNPLSPWLNELLGEAAMQVSGYFTDVPHVQAYRAHPEWPLAVDGYGISYGALSLFAEYLAARFDVRLLGRLAPESGDSFARIEKVYGKSWSELFEGYAQWLYEQAPASRFPGESVKTREPAKELWIAPTGVAYLKTPDAEILSITAVPKGCVGSRNVVRTRMVLNQNSPAQALWVESSPPCGSTRGGTGFEKDAFKLEVQ